MGKREVRRPFFVVNPKSYLYGDEIVALAKHADLLAEKYDIDTFFTAQLIDLPAIQKETSHLILTAQHLDGITPGRGMGHVLPEALYAAGVQATFLNHAEHAMTLNQLAKAMTRADEVGILTIACADTVEEAKAIAELHPDIMVCEPTSLIGTGKVSDENYMSSTNEAVKSVSPKTLVLQAAGISSGQNVYDAILSGADGTGGTSGIVAAKDPCAVLDEMFCALDKIRNEIK
ncbi:MAG: triose-phosphate isomerase [Ruthenibacterium sp.]